MSAELQFLYRILSVTQPYREDFVVVGGFASLLYPFHERAQRFGGSSLLTYDVDLASEERVPIRQNKSVHRMLVEADLGVELMGECEPPVMKYFPKEKTDSRYRVEFLTPLFGSEVRRDGTRDITQKIQQDLSAQKLRYLDLLLENTWKLHMATIPALKKQPDLIVKIPHPCMYIMQKILISDRRPLTDRNKDFAYIYQTLTCFGKDITSLANEYRNLIEKPEWKRWYSRFIRCSREIFGSPERDGPMEASRILNDATPEMISAVVMHFTDHCPTLAKEE